MYFHKFFKLQKQFSSKLIFKSAFLTGSGLYLFKRIGYSAEETKPHSFYSETEKYSPADSKLLEYIRSTDKKDMNIVLYQYEVCPFCCKVRAFLNYHNIPYQIVEVNPISKGELKFSEYKKVPVVVLNNSIQLNDSSYIISAIDSVMNEKENNIKTKEYIEKELKWRKYIDDRFVRVIPPNIYRSMEESIEAFDYITSSKYAGAIAMNIVSKKLKKKYNIENEREAIYECGDKFIESIEKGKKFCGGDKPNLGDLGVFGILSSIEGLRTFNDLMNHNPYLGEWYDEMKQLTSVSSSPFHGK